MAIDPAKILFLDCQTTGMHPSLAHLLEIAWVSGTGETRSFLIKLPEGKEIPHRVQDVTSIRVSDMSAAVDPEIALSALETDLEEIGEGALLVVHYAQFERAFLEALFEEKRGTRDIPARFLCTYKVARKLFPQVPSRNIRALVGYFELGSEEIKRANAHAAATAAIWKHLEKELSRMGLESLEEIEAWLAEKKRGRSPVKIEYRVDRIRRLELPDRPGVYRMLSKSGRVLYVGKATSLKSRVNSYFRGQKGKKKLEMLAQVWDLDVTECASSLEAALLENEEIKRLDPPYNISLRAGRRRLVFYTRDFSEGSLEQGDSHFVGPFSFSNAIELVRRWVDGQRKGEPAQIFYEPLLPEELKAGYLAFCVRHGLAPEGSPSVRSLLAIGLKLAREQRKLDLLAERAPTEKAEEPKIVEDLEKSPLTPEAVADRYEGVLLRAAGEYLRSKMLTRLLNARVSLGKGERVLETRGGRIWREGGSPPVAGKTPWSELNIVDYDRMSVLLTEIIRHAYPVETLPPL